MGGGFAMKYFEQEHELAMQRELNATDGFLLEYLGNCSQ